MEDTFQDVQIEIPQGIQAIPLDKSKFPVIGSTKHETSPDEVIAHLKLLKAFTLLKDLVIPSSIDESQRSKIWNCYLHLAVRRFIIFVSALKSAFPESLSKSFNSFMQTMVPPIDILLVWHTFLLRPKSMFDNFSWNGFPKFLKFPFPLYETSTHIDETFIYSPSIESRKTFTLFIENYFIKCNINEPFNYDSYAEFDPSSVKLPVICPVCSQCLGDVYLYDERYRFGFSDVSFQFINTNNCSCGFNVHINHNELRKRLLFNDVTQSKIMPLVECYYSNDLNNKELAIFSPEEVDENLKGVISESPSYYKQLPLLSFITIMQHRFDVGAKPIIRDYISMNLIHLTIPSSTAFVLHEDLVSSILRQEIFTKNIIDGNWLFCEDLENSVSESIRRYHNFFRLTKSATHPVIPTSDIELVWNTHQLSHSHYFNYSRNKIGYVLDFCNDFDGLDFDLSVEKTTKLYESHFKNDYLACRCGSCNSKKRKAETSLESHQLDEDGNGSINSREIKSCLTHEHRIKRNKSYPWDDESFSLASTKISSPVTPSSLTPSHTEILIQHIEANYCPQQVDQPKSSRSPGDYISGSLFDGRTSINPQKIGQKKRSGSLSLIDHWLDTA